MKKYYEEKEKELREKTIALCNNNLPKCCYNYLFSNNEIAVSTRYSYANELKYFLDWLHQVNPVLSKKSIKEITTEELGSLTGEDMLAFQIFLNEKSYTNMTRVRKLCAVIGLYDYLFKVDAISDNPAKKLVLPSKKAKKEQLNGIVYLDPDEVERLFEAVLSSPASANDQRSKEMAERKKARDYAIINLLLYTGIRISELVGLDLDDIYFEQDEKTIAEVPMCNYINVHRKGGVASTVYFGASCRAAVEDYISYRENMKTKPGSEQALFLSERYSRISVSSCEKMTSEYASLANIHKEKKITPHKLRSTYATSLYRTTSDLYLTAMNLGHSDLQVTRDHYAALVDSERQKKSSRLDY